MKRRTRGYMMIECLVYIGAVFALLGVGYAAMYRCIENSVALRRNADDITRCLHAGERWRADVRLATAPVRLEKSDSQQVLQIPTGQGEILYLLSSDGISRRFNNHPWAQVLANVQSATIEQDTRQNVTVWRWDLELKSRAKAGRVRPLFTFIAVPDQHSLK